MRQQLRLIIPAKGQQTRYSGPTDPSPLVSARIFLGARSMAMHQQATVAEQGQITEHFTRAIDQLGATDEKGEPTLEIRRQEVLHPMSCLKKVAVCLRGSHLFPSVSRSLSPVGAMRLPQT